MPEQRRKLLSGLIGQSATPETSKISDLIKGIQEDTKLQLRQLQPNHWQLNLRNTKVEYTLDIQARGSWVTYGTVLMPDVQSKNSNEKQKTGEFYKEALGLNGRLNGVHLGLENDQIILSREELPRQLDRRSFIESIALMDKAVEQVYPELDRIARGLNLKPKQSKPQDLEQFNIKLPKLLP